MTIVKNNLTESVTAHFEILSSLVAFAWGLVLSNPATDVFARQNALYRPLSQINSHEEFWGILFIFLALFSIYAVLRGSPLTRKILAGVQFFSWFFISMCFAWSDFWGSPGALIYFCYATGAAVSFSRLKTKNG